MYHYKGKWLRKLHNLADAVIVLDEVHMLPVKMLQPCLRALGFLTKYLHSEVLLLSATMPDYTPLFSAFSPECSVHTLITDRSDFGAFEKCTYYDLGETDYESITMRSAQYSSSLIVVNSRAAARIVYGMLSGEKYHLSTYMTAHDRSAVIKKIRVALHAGTQVQVVSTSLIEAGVDLDFEVVFRELAGLDSILQSGGRCNREGKRPNGNVFIFQTGDKLQRDLQQRASITKDLLEAYPKITALECITEYYRRLFNFRDEDIKANTIAAAVTPERNGFLSVPFRTYANQFEMIEADTVGVIINNCDETEKLLERLRYGDHSVLRKLQQHTVSLRRRDEFTKAYPNIVGEYEHTGVFVLNDLSCYDAETGLYLDAANDIIFG